MKGFIIFLRSQGVAGLAIGFLLGGAVSKLIGAFVQDIVNPLIGALFTDIDALADAKISIGSAHILWGDFVTVLLDFLIISAVVYFFFKKLALEKMDKKK
tara:strand:- start:120 stop:419 length:300 start_codon:yes stop_codon:yes gene_type:complete